MGRMYFPGERVQELLPPRKTDTDFVGHFGAWLTKRGVLGLYYASYCIMIALIVVKSFLWVVETFCSNILLGVLSLFGACFIVAVGSWVSLGVAVVVALVVWLLSWVFYNKWTLIVFVVSAFLLYYSPYGELIVENWLPTINEYLIKAWQWYKEGF